MWKTLQKMVTESDAKSMPTEDKNFPSKNQKNLVLEFFIVCWMQKSVCEYLVPFSNESVRTSAGCSKKKLPNGNSAVS